MSQADQHGHDHPHEPGLSAGGGRAGPRRGGRVGLTRALAAAVVLALAPWSRAAPQERPWARVGAQAIPSYQEADPVPGGGSLGEVRVVQPAVMVRAGALDRLRLTAMLNLEGLTIPEGELAPGNWGEGFVDRRHPHTYLHELMLTADDLVGRSSGRPRLSVSVGKGFAPFGTDDPMVRPFVRYPVNHHLAQILERAVAIAAVRVGPVIAEGGVFNGDEPERPGQWPLIEDRFGDSWSGRLTVLPVPGASIEASRAHVHSPEHRPGAGPDQEKWSVAGRWDGPIGGHPVYGLLEWARTSEADGFFVFHSFLAEGAWGAGPHRLQYRFERTERPEEERIASFRSLRPHLENSILGITRWTSHTLGYELRALMNRTGPVSVRPLIEIQYAEVAKVGGGVVDVLGLYGQDHIWSLILGARIGLGMSMDRMGRYGAATGEEDMAMHDDGMVMP